MGDKILEIVKIIVEKYIYKTFFSLAASIIIVTFKAGFFEQYKLSILESKVLIFAVCFCFLGISEYVIRFISKKKSEIWESKLDIQKCTKEVKDYILTLPFCDKKILYDFIVTENKVQTLCSMEYTGTLVRLNMYNPMYFGRLDFTASEHIDVIKTYSKESGIGYIDFKLEDEFYRILIRVNQKYGKSCFEA